MSPILGIMASQGAGARATAFESIATVTATGGETSFTFSSIPSTYKSLQIRGIGGTNYANYKASYRLSFNGDTGANYADHLLFGDAATAQATGGTGGTFINWAAAFPSASLSASFFGASIVDVHDYASTTKNKTARAIYGLDQNSVSANTAQINLASGLWLSTAAITSIGISQNGTSFRAGSTFALYGIKAAA